MKKIIAALALACSMFVLFANGSKDTAKKGAELIIDNETEPQSLDPTQIQGVPELNINLALFEGLVSYDPKTCHAVPGVATSWDRSDDGTVLTFHLRDAVWSDGTPITAQTFVDSWLYYLAPSTAAVYAYMPAMIIKGASKYNAGKADASTVGIRAVDPHTFEVTLVGPLPYAVDMMAHYAFDPLPMHAIKKYGKDWIKPGNFVGNGPFVLEDWVSQQKITVVPNDKYWNKANVFLSKITFLPIEDLTTGYNKYKNGEIDWMANAVPPAMLDEIKLRDDFQTSSQISTYYYEFNMNDPVLKDVRVRKALSMAVNRQDLVDNVTKGGQIPTGAFVPPMTGYTPVSGTTFDLEGAKKELAAAGYPDGKGFPKLTLIYNTSDNHKRTAEYIQQQWKENLGIDVSLENMEWATFLSKRQANDFQIARDGWVGDYMDPSNFLELLMTGSGNNDGRYSNAEYDKLVHQAATMQAGDARNKVLEQAEKIAIADDQTLMPLYYYVSQNLIDTNKWEGWYTNPLDVHPYVGLKLKK